MKQEIIFNRIKKLCLLITFAACLAANALAQNPQTKPAVMILGTYHMANPGRDLNNVKADDVLAEKRQKEIAEFVSILKKFKPTKIAVEAVFDNPEYVNHYAEYLAGKYELKRNEIDQIGFRLAKEMGHKQVFGIDWHNSFDFDKVTASAKANNQDAIAQEMMTYGKTVTDEMSGMMKTATVNQMFSWLNDDRRVDEWHQPYLKITRVGKGADYAGTDLTADWYARNLRIFTNLERITESPNDRILVIYGAGHHKLLQDFVRQSGEYDLIKTNDVIGEVTR